MKCLFYIVILTTFQVKVIHSIYKTNLLSAKECENPTPPKCKPSIVEAKFEIYRKPEGKLVNGSIEIKTNIIPFISFRSGTEGKIKAKNNKLSYPKINCKNVASKLLLTAMNVTYNDDTCEILKGNYRFVGFDINKFAKFDYIMSLVPVRLLGINTWSAIIYENDCTYICIVTRVEVILLKNNPQQIV